MSVINSVLKDLEARETRFTPIRIDALEPSATKSGHRGSVIAAVALAALVAILVWLLWRVPAPNAVAALTPAIEPAMLATFADSAVASPAAEPRNRIVGLQLRESSDDLRLEFALRERPVAYLRHRDGNRIGYHLRAVDSDIEAPSIDDSDWLERLALEPRDGGVDIDFVTAPGVLVETRQARVAGEPVWAILLRRPPAATSTETPVAGAPAAGAPAATIASPVERPEIAANDLPPAAHAAPAAEAASSPIARAPIETDTADVRLDIRSTDPSAPARNQLHYATELINAGRFADAEALLDGLLDGPQDVAAREHLLAFYQLAGRRGDFARLARDSAQRYPAATVFVTEYARLLMQSTAYGEVVALLAPAVGLDADGQALLAAAYQRLGRHADAIRHYQLAVARDADEPRHWIGLGISQEHNAALEDALNSYRTAARLGPPSERLRAFVAKRADTLDRVLD